MMQAVWARPEEPAKQILFIPPFPSKIPHKTMATAPAITAYTPTFNEAAQIRAVLESVKWADEIILVDSFSTDGSVALATEYGAAILPEKLCGFGTHGNCAL